MLRVIQIFTLLLTALVLIPGGAHLFELAHKLELDRQSYFTLQGIYRGWALFGLPICIDLVALLLLTIMLWYQGRPFVLALLAFLCIGASLAIFFHWTFPVNQLTQNWTAMPEDWQTLRRQWEYSHAANAAITFFGFFCLVLSSVPERP